MSDRDADFGAFLVGFVLGGLVGAAVALLLAPQSGEQTRAVIRDKSIELKDLAAETAEEARVRAQTTLEEARAKAEEFAATTKEKAATIQERGKIVIGEQRAKLDSAIEAGQSKLGKKADEGEVETSTES